MVFALGVILFALALLASVALHECGHMWVARATGMKVRRYFVGFGPKIWSIRRGETEYGLKAIPAGGFCDIAGMTAIEELAPEEESRAMYRQKVWKRVAVLLAGPAMNFVIGIVIIYVVALGWGLPNFHGESRVALSNLSCAAPQNLQGQSLACAGEGPAQQAGIQNGDIVTEINGQTVGSSADDVVNALRATTGPVRIAVDRDGQSMTFTVTPALVPRLVTAADGTKTLETVPTIGTSVSAISSPWREYNPITATWGAVSFTGDLLVKTGQAIVSLPGQVSKLWHAIDGGERDPSTPMSVYGASVAGGETIEHGAWETFLLLLASLNLFLGVFNLLPLLPFDGGHIAIATYEKLRAMFRSRRGLAAAAPVNYLKLMPLTYIVLVVAVSYSVLVLTADIVNPIKIFQ